MKRPMRRPIATALLLSVAALTGCAVQPNDNTFPGQAAVGDDGYTVTVYFDRVENLVPNSNVQRDNVVIGTVTAIEADDWKAKVTLRLLESEPVPEESLFSIGQKTLLGAQYVEVSSPVGRAPAKSAGGGRTGAVPSGGVLEDGDVVPVRQTGNYPATEQVLGAVALLLNNGGLAQISTITKELRTALDGRVPDARHLLERTNALIGTLDDNKDEIIRALDALDSLSGQLADDKVVIADAVDRIGPGLRALNEERENLVRTVTSVGRTGTEVSQLIQVNEQALLANLDSLEPILGRLGEVSRKLPDALKIGLTIPFPAMTTTDALHGDYANLFANLDVSIPSLSDAFLGDGVPTPFGAVDPIEDPLQDQGGDDGEGDAGDDGTGGGPGGGTGGGGSGGGDDGGDDGGGGTDDPDGDTAPDDCLLDLIGAC